MTALAFGMAPLSGFADGADAGEWQYREVIDQLTGEVGWKGVSLLAVDAIAKPYDGTAQVELLYGCSHHALTLRAVGAVFFPEDITSDGSRFFQTARFVVDEGAVQRAMWVLPTDWVSADVLFGIRRVDEMLAGSWLKLEVKHVVGMDMRKSVLTFRTTGWRSAVNRHCAAGAVAAGGGDQ